MSKWRKPLKNQRRFDARYFLNERMESEGAEENSVQQEKLKKDFNDFSFDSWLAEAAVALEEENVEESLEGEEEAEDITEISPGRSDYGQAGNYWEDDTPARGSAAQARVDAASRAKLSKRQNVVDAEDEKAAKEKAKRKAHLDKVAAVVREPKDAWRKRQDGLEELHVHAHAAEKPMSLPITDEKPPVRKKKPPVKKEKLGPVHWDPPKNLEESETEES